MVLRQKETPIDLTADEEETLLRGIASIKAGKGTIGYVAPGTFEPGRRESAAA